jgi:hypothetical protein
MKCMILSTCVLLTVFSLRVEAQSPRLCLYELFSGENSPPAAATNSTLNPLLASPTNTPKIVTLNWEVPIPSAPTNSSSLYQTNKSDIDWRWKSFGNGGYGYTYQQTSTSSVQQGIVGSPSGLIDGQYPWLFGAQSMHPAFMNNTVIATAQSYTSAFSISLNRGWNTGATAVTLTVNIQATVNFTAVGSLVFRMVMVEKNVYFNSPPGTNGETFFQDVAIASYPTLQGGTAMVPTWTVGQAQSFTLQCNLPSYVRDKSEVDMVGFIQDDGNRTVAQAVRSGRDPLINDAKAVSSTIQPIYCVSAQISPTLVIRNVGSNIINSFTLTPYINGSAAANYFWNGSLSPGASTVLTLPSFSSAAVVPGNNTFSYTIVFVNGGDLNFANNSWSNKFSLTGTAPAQLTPNFTTGCIGLPLVLTPSGGISYTLDPGGLTGGSFTVFPTGMTTYTLTVETSPGCIVQNAAQSNVNAYPSPTVVVPSASLCLGNEVTIVPTGALGYTLYPGAQSGSSFVVSPTVTTTYTIAGIIFNCVSNKTVNVTVQQLPLPSVGVTASPSISCRGEKTSLTGTGALSYTWSNSSVATTIYFIAVINTIYFVTGQDSSGCRTTAVHTQSVVDCTMIPKEWNAPGNALRIYPNPAQGAFEISARVTCHVEVFNAIGQIMRSVDIGEAEGFKSEISQLPPGVYFVRSGEAVSRIVIH